MPRRRTNEEGGGVQSVSRALTILEALAREGAPVSLSDLAKKVELKLTTVHRLLTTLVGHGFAEQDENTHYRLGLKALMIGNAALHTLDLRTIARPYLLDLVSKLNETVNLAILDRGEVVYIDQVESTNMVIVKMFARVGSRGPAHCTGTGKVLLAGLPDAELLPLLAHMDLRRFTSGTIVDQSALLDEIRRIRADGFGLDRGERDEGVFCVAAPIFNHESRVAAAVSVSGPVSRITEGVAITNFAPVVKEIALGISRRLGYQQQKR